MQDINLYQLLKFYAKNWIWIISLTIIGGLAGFIYNNYLQVPLYKSGATLLLISPADGKVTQDATLINNYVELFKSRRVLEPVIAKQNLDISYDTLVSSIDATNEKNTEVIKVAISTKNAQASKNLAEGAVVSFKEQVTQLYKVDNVKIVDDANLPTEPYNVHKELILILSTAIGLILSTVVLFFIYDFSLTKKTTKKVTSKKQKTTQRLPLLKRVATMLVGSAETSHVQKNTATKAAKKKPANKKNK